MCHVEAGCSLELTQKHAITLTLGLCWNSNILVLISEAFEGLVLQLRFLVFVGIVAFSG
jgi:hypothetical protein